MIVHVLRNITVLALGFAGAVNIAWMLKRRESPAEARGFRFAASTCIWLAVALWAYGAHSYFMAALALVVSIFSAGFWFYHIFRQSLHNTTM